MAKCKVDCVSSPTFAKLLRKLSKKYPHIRGDLEAVIPDIGADYMNNCHASRPPKRKLNVEHWKYEFGSTDLRRGPRHSFRLIGVFLEPAEEAKDRTLFLCLVYFKGDKADVTEDEVRDTVAELRLTALQGELTESFPEDQDSN